MKKMILLMTSMSALIVPLGYSDQSSSSKSKEVKKPQSTPDQFTENISLCYEVFSVSLPQAANWQRQKLGDTEIYRNLVAGLNINPAMFKMAFLLLSRPL